MWVQQIKGRLRVLEVACWTTDHYHPCLNPGVGIFEGCFNIDFASLPLEVVRPIYPTMCTNVAVKHKSSSSIDQAGTTYMGKIFKLSISN